MLVKLSLAVVGALIILPPNVCAGENTMVRCVDISVPKNAVTARNGKWIELTRDQWQFLRGVYALNAETPAGLLYGDKAVLAQLEHDAGGLVFFIDGDKACTPMHAPPELLVLMDEVTTDQINHEGTGLSDRIHASKVHIVVMEHKYVKSSSYICDSAVDRHDSNLYNIAFRQNTTGRPCIQSRVAWHLWSKSIQSERHRAHISRRRSATFWCVSTFDTMAKPPGNNAFCSR